jgi:hypothetical protein
MQGIDVHIREWHFLQCTEMKLLTSGYIRAAENCVFTLSLLMIYLFTQPHRRYNDNLTLILLTMQNFNYRISNRDGRQKASAFGLVETTPRNLPCVGGALLVFRCSPYPCNKLHKLIYWLLLVQEAEVCLTESLLSINHKLSLLQTGSRTSGWKKWWLEFMGSRTSLLTRFFLQIYRFVWEKVAKQLIMAIYIFHSHKQEVVPWGTTSSRTR